MRLFVSRLSRAASEDALSAMVCRFLLISSPAVRFCEPVGPCQNALYGLRLINQPLDLLCHQTWIFHG
jgi:hypothetical protein